MGKGTVLRIEKTSICDGEGLRTVIYLKGCPLRCQWCSTPESQSRKIEKGFGQIMTTKEVMKEIEKDAVFFFHSQGGVTISGGEALVQADFVQELLQESIYSGINTTLETSFYVDYQAIRKVGPFLSSLYVDIKLFDSEKHQQWTGVSNELVLQNLKKFVHEFPECPVHIRVPVIPTVNLNHAELLNIAQFAAGLPSVKDLELLPYHRYGLQSYQQLGLEYVLKNIETPTNKTMIELTKFLSEKVAGLSIITLSESFKKDT